MWRCELKTAKMSLRRRSLKAPLHRLRFICVIVAADILAQSHVVTRTTLMYQSGRCYGHHGESSMIYNVLLRTWICSIVITRYYASTTFMTKTV